MTTAAQMVQCQNCGADAGLADRFCGTCGAGITQFSPEESIALVAQRRRLGGTEWQPTTADAVQTPTITAAPSKAAPVRRRRRRRRRPWYRRKRTAIPSAILLLAFALSGAAFYRAENALSTVRDVSRPPSTISGDQFGEDAALTVDTGPATDALSGAGETSGSGGLLGGIKHAVRDGADLAKGAAVAAGVKDRADDSLTILIMGVDARPGTPIDVSVRSDVLIVAHINPSSASCRLLAIPRDTRTNLPGYGLTKINHALLVGGIPYQRMVVEQTLGIAIDDYALIDFTGFKDLVDAVGGVDIIVKEAFSYQSVTFSLGRRHLNGDEALLFARYRGGTDGDIGRIRRQQQLIRALMAARGGKDMLSNPGHLLSALEQHIRTDIETNTALSLAHQYTKYCANADVEMDVLQGQLVTPYDQQQPDPMLKRKEYYNVVTPEQIQSKVRVLMGD
ncbi:MAG: LCP family protein [Thermomicrobiales bacterium]